MLPALGLLVILLFSLAVFQATVPDRWEVRVHETQVVLQRAASGHLRERLGWLFAGLLGLAAVLAVGRFRPLLGLGVLVLGGGLLALAIRTRLARGQVVFDQSEDLVRHGGTRVGRLGDLRALEWQAARRQWRLVFRPPDGAERYWTLPGAPAAQRAELAEQVAYALGVPWRYVVEEGEGRTG